MNAEDARGKAAFARSRRLVIKLGSRLVADKNGVRAAWLRSIADDIVRDGREIVIVSSGATALGCAALGADRSRLRLEEQQAAAAVGQSLLMDAWGEAFARHKRRVAQILLTLDDTERRERSLNARDTIDNLFAIKALPVINENDSVATEELRFGDNDRLAARVAQLIKADLLILFSDIDGLYDKDPARFADAKPVPYVKGRLSAAVRAMAGAAQSFGSGGMVTKLDAAHIALACGCATVIADGRDAHPLARLRDEGGRRTWFLPDIPPQSAHKRWIAGALKARGALVIDKGAARALEQGSSLLAVGITHVEGTFHRGDIVAVKSEDGTLLGRGLAQWSSAETERLRGKQSSEHARILGYRGKGEALHRDDLVLHAAAPREE